MVEETANREGQRRSTIIIKHYMTTTVTMSLLCYYMYLLRCHLHGVDVTISSTPSPATKSFPTKSP